jgi:hypothetical protein
MNIEQYRALKAQEANQASAPAPTPVVETKPVEIPVVKTKPTETESNKAILPEKVNIEGIGEVSFDELKSGYLRQSDYTKKTQEVARHKREVQDAVTLFEQLKANPELIKQVTPNIQVPPTLDPSQAKIMELESKVYDMMLEHEITTLQSKYPDFEIREVAPVAQEKNLTNLEDAYFIAKSRRNPAETVDKASLEKQIREQIIREMEAEKNATQTIISTRGNIAPIQDSSPKLSDAEKKVARMMKLTDADYAKWRDADRRK